MTAAAAAESEEFSAQEAELYDRQIRLWGLDAQKRLRGARILVAGVPPLAGEAVKNLVLAGVRSVDLLDDAPLTPADVEASFVYDAELVGRASRAEAALTALRQLNPMVTVSARPGRPADLAASSAAEDALAGKFDAVLAVGQPVGVLETLDRLCRGGRSRGRSERLPDGDGADQQQQVVNGAAAAAAAASPSSAVQFFAADCFGCHGYLFIDLQQHEYAVEVQVPGPKPTQVAAAAAAASPSVQTTTQTEVVKRTVDYPDFDSVLRTRWDPARLGSLRRLPPALYLAFLLFEFQRANGGRRAEPGDADAVKALWRAFAEAQQLPANLLDEAALASGLREAACPVLAILGGVTAQEIIKAVSHKDDPFNNFFVFDGIQSCGSVQALSA